MRRWKHFSHRCWWLKSTGSRSDLRQEKALAAGGATLPDVTKVTISNPNFLAEIEAIAAV